MKQCTFSKYYISVYLCVRAHDIMVFLSCNKTMEGVCFGGSQIGMWSLMWLGPECPDRFGSQEHHSELIPSTRLPISESIILVKPRCVTDLVHYFLLMEKKYSILLKLRKKILCYSHIEDPGRRNHHNLIMSSIHTILVTFP